MCATPISRFYVTESSGHNSEYNAWFRKRPDLIEKYCTRGTGWNPGKYAFIRDEYISRKDTWRAEIESELEKVPDITRGEEYAAFIFNAVFGDHTPFEFNGNVPNAGKIENLPYDCCVEVPVNASKNGLRAMQVGKLPEHLAILVNTSARCETLAIQGFLEGDKRKIFHSVLMDPLTSSVLSMEETQEMVNAMFAFNKEYLPFME